MKATEDPTLRQGDVVATENGFVAYSGSHKKTADFTPINNSGSGVSAESRRQLAQTRIAPAPASTPAAINRAASGPHGKDPQAQLESYDATSCAHDRAQVRPGDSLPNRWMRAGGP